ncbi:MAG: threonine synthase [Rhodospirillales bacterium]
MLYHSTRGAAAVLDFDEVLLTGLARDGGLYLPAQWPGFSAATWRGLAGADYRELAAAMLRPYLGQSVLAAELPELLATAYASFAHQAVAPLVQVAPNLWLLELFHGPTLAFKDVAMQILGQFFQQVLARRGERITIVGATSGDTGSAAIEALRDHPAVEVFILHPKDRTSEVQRRQMTGVQAANIHNLAVEGSFDDCQDLVKALFNDQVFRDRHRLSAVNSINWARILAQSVYYAYAALALGGPERQVDFVVPTGNFGNVFAGYVAQRMGLPLGKLVVAANSNDILPRFLESGSMALGGVAPTLSPSMDIQVSSNFERLLFEALGRDGAKVAETLTRFRAEGSFALEPDVLAAICARFEGGRLDDDGTLAEIKRTHEETGLLIDPHTAVGLSLARRRVAQGAGPSVVLSTAHPAKFPDAVERATGLRPALPQRLADLFERPERMTVVSKEEAALKALIDARLSGASAA